MHLPQKHERRFLAVNKLVHGLYFGFVAVEAHGFYGYVAASLLVLLVAGHLFHVHE